MSEPYHANIDIHLKCLQCGYICPSYDILIAHQNNYCYYTRSRVSNRMALMNDKDSRKNSYQMHNNLDTASDIHHSVDDNMGRRILAIIPRLSTTQVNQQTTKKSLRSLRVSL